MLKSGETRVPVRTCVGCGQKGAPQTMLRIASHDGVAPVIDQLNARHKGLGRGAYLCAKKLCLERAVGKRALERSLKLNCGLSSAAKAEIARTIENRNEGKSMSL